MKVNPRVLCDHGLTEEECSECTEVCCPECGTEYGQTYPKLEGTEFEFCWVCVRTGQALKKPKQPHL